MSSKGKKSGMEEGGKPALVPKLRFPEFRGAWEKKALETLGYFTGGGTPSKENTAYWAGDIPWVSSSDLDEDSISQISVTRFITKQAVSESATKLVPAKSILLISRVGVGKLAVSMFPLCTSQDFTNFTPNNADPFFLAYLLKSQKDTLLSFNQGTSIKGFTKDNVAKLLLGVPSPAEQKKIAECLTSLDELIAAQARKVDALEKHKKGLMQDLFPREGETQPRGRFPEFQDAREWEVRAVGDVFRTTRGQVLPMSSVNEEPSPKAPYPVYSSQTKNGGLAGYYSDYLFEDAITWTTDGANAGDVNFRSGQFYCTNVCGVLLNSQGYANACVAALLNSVTRSHVSYVGNPKLMNGVMAQIEIPFPPLAEQHRIANCLSVLDALIATEAQKLEAIKCHKRGLMQQLFPAAEEADG